MTFRGHVKNSLHIYQINVYTSSFASRYMLAGSITSHFSGSGPLSSDIKVIYDELNNSEDDVKDAVTSLQSSGVKSLFIRAVFFDKRCSLNSVIKDIPDYLIEGYLESVPIIYGQYHAKGYRDEVMSNKELAEKAAELVEHGIDSKSA